MGAVLRGGLTGSPGDLFIPDEAVVPGAGAAGPLLTAVTGHLARQCPSWYDQVRLIDAIPGPRGTLR